MLCEALETDEVVEVGFGGSGGYEGDLVAASWFEGVGMPLLFNCYN